MYLCSWCNDDMLMMCWLCMSVALADTFWIFIFSLNRAEKWFNSIFHSKLNPKYSFKKIIHSKRSQIIHSKKIFIQVKKGIITQGYGRPLPKNSIFHLKHSFWANSFTIYSFFFWILHIFIHSIIHSIPWRKIFIQRIIHSNKQQIIYSKKNIYSKRIQIIY